MVANQGEGRIYIKIHQTKLNQYGRQSDIQNNLDNHSVVVYILWNEIKEWNEGRRRNVIKPTELRITLHDLNLLLVHMKMAWKGHDAN